MCRVCSGALWILQSIAILFEPAHEIAVLVGLSCNEGSDEPAKMRLLARVSTKDPGEVRLTIEKEYRIATETQILHATDTLNSNLGGVVEVVGSRHLHQANLTVICLPHPSLHYLKSASTHYNYPQRPIGTTSRTLPRPTVHF